MDDTLLSSIITTPINTASTGNAFVKFTPISGCYQEGAPFCYLLEVDNTKILLDVGIPPDNLSTSHLSPLEHITPNVILLTHSGIEHCGGIPFIISKFNIKCPIYATTPVHNLGSLSLYEVAQGYSSGALPDHLDPTLIETVFNNNVTQVRYFQPIALSGGIILMAVPSGHSPGGAIWRIRKHGEEIFHILKMNHRKETTLDGAMLNLIHRPSLLIVDAYPALKPESLNIKDRNSQLIDFIQYSMKGNGSVLILSNYDRLIEIIKTLMVLNVKVYLCGYQVGAFLEILKSIIEWMGTSLMKDFEKTQGNPFKFENLTLINTLQDLDRLLSLSTPKVILSVGSLEHGFTKSLLQKILSDKSNSIIFTEEPTTNSLGQKILSSNAISLDLFEKELLEGEDLRRWKASKKSQEEQAAAEAAFAALQKRKYHITDQLAQEQEDFDEEGDDDVVESINALDQQERDGEKNKKDTLLLEEDINSAEMLREVYWSDYKNDWFLDPTKDKAMRAWIEDPESASLSILGGSTPGCRYQVFPIASGIVNTSLYPLKYINSPYGVILDFDSLYSKQLQQQENDLTVNYQQLSITSNALNPTSKRAPLIVKDDRPHRFVPRKVTFSVKCQKKFIDFSGLTDGKSLRIFLSKMSPRRTIVIGASAEATEFLYNHLLLTNSMSLDVMVAAPSKLYECVNVTQSQLLLSAVISDDLAKNCKVVAFNGFELGKMAFSIKVKDLELEEKDGQDEKIILENPNNSLVSNYPMMIGDLKLPQIKKSLINLFNLEFSSGDLIVTNKTTNKRIALIRKNDEGSIFVEGEVCPEYYQIREFLYSQLAILS